MTLEKILRATVFVGSALMASVCASENAMQCNQKLNSTLFGQSASETDLNIADPMARVDGMMADRKFVEHFASFVNAHMEWTPEQKRSQNPVYASLDFVIFDQKTNVERPWKDLFTLGYQLYDQGFNKSNDGGGYFNDRHWKRKYKGNEEDGFKLRSAYLILNNQIGLNLEALTVNNAGGSGRDARKDPNTVCYACHYKEEFALDRIANILPKVNRKASDAQNLIELPPPGPAPQVIYGQSVSNLKELTNALAEVDEFYTNACHIAFKFVFGRDERSADKPIFKECITKFKADGRISVAVRHFIDSDIFCQGLGV